MQFREAIVTGIRLILSTALVLTVAAFINVSTVSVSASTSATQAKTLKDAFFGRFRYLHGMILRYEMCQNSSNFSHADVYRFLKDLDRPTAVAAFFVEPFREGICGFPIKPDLADKLEALGTIQSSILMFGYLDQKSHTGRFHWDERTLTPSAIQYQNDFQMRGEPDFVTLLLGDRTLTPKNKSIVDFWATIHHQPPAYFFITADTLAEGLWPEDWLKAMPTLKLLPPPPLYLSAEWYLEGMERAKTRQDILLAIQELKKRGRYQTIGYDGIDRFFNILLLKMGSPQRPWEVFILLKNKFVGGNKHALEMLSCMAALDGHKNATDLLEQALRHADIDLQSYEGSDTARPEYYPKGDRSRNDWKVLKEQVLDSIDWVYPNGGDYVSCLQ